MAFCLHGEVGVWCLKCTSSDGAFLRPPAEDTITVKALVSFYETLDAVKSLPPAIRRERTKKRIEEEKGSIARVWLENHEKEFYSRRGRHSISYSSLKTGTVAETAKVFSEGVPPTPSSRTTASFDTTSDATSDAADARVDTSTDSTETKMEPDSTEARMEPATPSKATSDDFVEEEEEKEKVTSFFIVRHGERIDHIDEKWIMQAQRPFDPGLSERGMIQAKEVGEKLKRDGEDIDFIYSSPFQRTLETATEIAKVLGKKIFIETGIAESIRVESVKKWEEKEKRTWPALRLLTNEEIKKMFPLVEFTHTSVADITYPETEEQLYQRIVKVVNGLPKLHEGKKVLLVSHQSPVEYLAFELCAGNAQDKYVSYCCLSKATKRPDDVAFTLHYQHEDSFLSSPERGGAR